MHAAGHVAANLSFAAVAISLTHTVKTLEPAFNVILSKFILGGWEYSGCCGLAGIFWGGLMHINKSRPAASVRCRPLHPAATRCAHFHPLFAAPQASPPPCR